DSLPPVACLKGVAISSWNPPPPQRSMVGDLLYLEVFTLDKALIHVTCTPEGFYVNRTNHDVFDPTPADNACWAHELLCCLLAYSGSFSKVRFDYYNVD
ncbi:unnamed protein product, partial [Choristocarpus tenellus]